MSLFDAQRKRRDALERRAALPASEVIRELRKQAEQGLAAEGDTGSVLDAAAAALSAGPSDGIGGSSRPNATHLAALHVEGCQGLFKTVEKKTNVLEIVRGIVSGDSVETGLFSGPSDSKQFIEQARKRRQQRLDASNRKQLGTLKALHGSEGPKLIGLAEALLGDNSWETCAAAIQAWHLLVRRNGYEKRRAAMQSALAWDDPERALAVIRAREILAQADRLSWFSVAMRHATTSSSPVEDTAQENAPGAAFPLSTPPALRPETGDNFIELCEELRTLLRDVVKRQQADLKEAERVVIDRWMMKEKTKDVRRVRARDDAAAWKLECSKRRLNQAHLLVGLFQQFYATSLARSVERTAASLAQLFSDTSFLQIRVMAMPLLPARTGNDGPEATLVTSPSHGDVQAHLNLLLESVVNAAGLVPRVRIDPPPTAPPDANEEESAAAAEAAAFYRANSGCTATLQRFLAGSPSYKHAVQGLDKQLRRSFKAVEKRLEMLRSQFDVNLLTQSAVLSGLYLDRTSIFKKVCEVNGAAEEAIPSDCRPEAATIGSGFLADFLLFWLDGPRSHLVRVEGGAQLKSVLTPLFRCVAKVLACTSGIGLEVHPLPSEVAIRITPDEAMSQSEGMRGAAIRAAISEAIEGSGKGCTKFHAALQEVAHNSGSLADVILQHLMQVKPFKEACLESMQLDWSHMQAMCTWLQSLQHDCEQWDQAVTDVRAVYQCGPFALDMRYLVFVASQVSPLIFGVCSYVMNLFGVHSSRNLWKEVHGMLVEVNQPVSTMEEMVREMQLLRGIYFQLTSFQACRSEIDVLLHTLAGANRSSLLVSRASRLPQPGGLRFVVLQPMIEGQTLDEDADDQTGEPSPATGDGAAGAAKSSGVALYGGGLGHPEGGLSTGSLAFLATRAEEALTRLLARIDIVIATATTRSIPFHHKVHDETVAVNETARLARVELEAMLSPSLALAVDPRCIRAGSGAAASTGEEFSKEKLQPHLNRTGSQADEGPKLERGTTGLAGLTSASGNVPTEVGDKQKNQGEAPAAVDVAGLLTAGGLPTYTDVETALADFERRCQQIEARRRLVLQFEALAGEDSSFLFIPCPDVTKELRLKLAELRLFWRAAKDWDRAVDNHLRMRPDRIRVVVAQQQAHTTLRAVRSCPAGWQVLLRQRVDAFRQLLRPLFLVQSIMSLKNARAIARVSTSQSLKKKREPPQKDEASNPQHGFPGLPEEDPMLFSYHQGHVWAALFAQPVAIVPSGISGEMEELTSRQKKQRGGGFDPNESMTTLKRLHRAGVLDDPINVARQYEMAVREFNEMGRMVTAMATWASQELTITGPGMVDAGAPVLHEGGDLVERLEAHRGMVDALLARAKPYPGLFASGGGSSGSPKVRKAEQDDDHHAAEQLSAEEKRKRLVKKDDASQEIQDGLNSDVKIGPVYKAMAESWRDRLVTMRKHLIKFLACQEKWQKLSPLLFCEFSPDSAAAVELRRGDTEFRYLAEQMAFRPSIKHCLEELLGKDDSQLQEANRCLAEARKLLVKDLHGMRSRCYRLFLLEDDALIDLWGCSALAEDRQQAIINSVIPQMFPGWRTCGFAAAERAEREMGSPTGSTGDSRVRQMTITEARTALPGRPLVLLTPLVLSGNPDQWVSALEAAVALAFRRALRSLAPGASAHWPLLKEHLGKAQREVSRDWESKKDKADETEQDPKGLTVGEAAPDGRSSATGAVSAPKAGDFFKAAAESLFPEHVKVTAERIHWTYMVEAWKSNPNAIACLMWHVKQGLTRQLGAQTDGDNTGVLLLYFLELRDLLERAKAEKLQAGQLVFLRLGWRTAEHLVVSLDPVSFDFGWELYSGEQLVCPIGERYFVTAAQQLSSCKCPLFQGNLGGTVTQSFAAACGVACHQLCVLPDEDSVTGLYRHLMGSSLLGHWVVIHGVDVLPEPMLSPFLKHLAGFFLRLCTSLEVFAKPLLDHAIMTLPGLRTALVDHHKYRHHSILVMSNDTKGRNSKEPVRSCFGAAQNYSDALRFLTLPPGIIEIRDTTSQFDKSKLQLPHAFKKLIKPIGRARKRSSHGHATNIPECRRRRATSWDACHRTRESAEASHQKQAAKSEDSEGEDADSGAASGRGESDSEESRRPTCFEVMAADAREPLMQPRAESCPPPEDLRAHPLLTEAEMLRAQEGLGWMDEEEGQDDSESDEEEKRKTNSKMAQLTRSQDSFGNFHATNSTNMYIPRVMHPKAALFVAPSCSAQELRSVIFRPTSFPPADMLLYIHAGLARAGIFDLEAARMLSRAMSTFNAYICTPPARGSVVVASSSSAGGLGRRTLGVAEVRSVCSFAATLRHSHQIQMRGDPKQALDEPILLCEAWLCAIGTLLDASAERELLWRCTTLGFGSAPNFHKQEVVFRQNLFNDTLMAQRTSMKDFTTRFYNKLADTLRQKFSFDFFNTLVVQKCLATTQALLQGRDVAVVGEAGVGKTDCLATLLEAGTDFPDDFGRSLFTKVKVIRVNTIAHDAKSIILVVARIVEEEQAALKRKQLADGASEGTGLSQEDMQPSTWLVLDGPLDPALFEAVSAAMPLTLLNSAGSSLSTPRRFRMIVETDYLEAASPATASALALTFIDTQRGPTWKDRVVAWAHRLMLTCPEYAGVMGQIRDLLVQTMDSILAFVLYYFHAAPRAEGDAAAASTEGDVAMLDYRHQTTCFLSFFTTLLMDPVIEQTLKKAEAESSLAFECQVRLLIGMSSISSFGSCLFTHQRPRFERYVRERVLDPVHAKGLPPLYGLYLDAKTGTFQAVNEIVRLTEPIIEAQNICVATEEFVAFQLRLRRLLAIDAPVMLAGTAGSGKSTLLRYLLGSRSPALACVLLRTTPSVGADLLQNSLIRQLHKEEDGGPFLVPPVGKRLVLLIDDLHLSTGAAAAHASGKRTVYSSTGTLPAAGPRPMSESSAVRAGTGGIVSGSEAGKQKANNSSKAYNHSVLAEWIRFTLEHRGFYRAEDGLFVPIRDASFLPSLLSPDSQSLQVCKRFSRHFFLVFMEIPSQGSIEKIFSTVLGMNFSAGLPEEVIQRITRQNVALNVHPTVEMDTAVQKLAAIVLDATLSVCTEIDLAAKARLHGLARVFWNVSHAFNLVPLIDLKSPLDAGFLWAFAMRGSVLDATLATQQGSRHRRICSAIARGCTSNFGLMLGGRMGTNNAEDPEVQAAELDNIAFACINDDGCISALSPGVRALRKVTSATACSAVERRLRPVKAPKKRGSAEGVPAASARLSVCSTAEGLPRGSLVGDVTAADDADQSEEAPDESESDESENGKSKAEGVAQDDPLLDPNALNSVKELLSLDHGASAIWLRDPVILCTLLRLCHALTLHPVLCLVGGWAQLPLLMLAARILAGSGAGELRLCSRITVEALEKELLASSGAATSTDESASAAARASKKKAADGSEGGQLRLLVISEDELPVEAPEAFLDNERRRYFQLAGGGLGSRKSTSEEDWDKAPPSGGLGANGEKEQQHCQQRLVVVCRSAQSFEALTTRCPYVRQAIAATFLLHPPSALQQIAVGYLPRKLEDCQTLGALPKHLKHRLAGPSRSTKQGRRLSLGGLKAEGRRPSARGASSAGSAMHMELIQQALFLPLAIILESLHFRLQKLLDTEWGRDFSVDFCTSCRFSNFLQCIVRLARQFNAVREQRVTTYEAVVISVDQLREFESSLDTKLRSVRVSLRLVVEEAGRLTTRVASEVEKKVSAEDVLRKVQEKQRIVESQIAAVDAHYGSELELKRTVAEKTLRQLLKVERCHFENLGAYQHLPQPLVRTLGAVQAVLCHLETLPEEEGCGPGDALSIPAVSVCPPAAESAVAVATANFQNMSMSQVTASQLGSQKLSANRSETLGWAAAMTSPDILDRLARWPSNQPLPGWLAQVLETFLAAPECAIDILWEMSPAASRLASWLDARLDVHRVLMRMEQKRQSKGGLSSMLAESAGSMAAAKSELARAEAQLNTLYAQHVDAVQQREEFTRVELTMKGQARRVAFLLETSAARRRECEAQLEMLQGGEESSENWGALVCMAAHVVYFAPFGPQTRAAMNKEVRQILHEANVSVPSDLWTKDHLRNFLPESFLHQAQAVWPERHLFESIIDSELSGSRATLVFDPFDQSLEWLKEFYTQRNPVAMGYDSDHGGLKGLPPSYKTRKGKAQAGKRLLASRALHQKGVAAKQDGSASSEKERRQRQAEEQPWRAFYPNRPEADNDEESGPEDWEDLPQADVSDPGAHHPLLASGHEPPEELLAKLSRCMQEGNVMVIQLENLAPLHGFVGALLLLLQGSESSASLCTAETSATLKLSQRFLRPTASNAAESTDHVTNARAALRRIQGETDAEVAMRKGLKVEVFNLWQRLEASLALAHRRFRLFVVLPWCPWNASLWGPARHKRGEHISKLPSMLWSTCWSMVSLDPRPVHPVSIFLPVFRHAKESYANLRAAEYKRRMLLAQRTRVLVAEELLLHILGKAEPKDMDGFEVVYAVRRLSRCSERLAEKVSAGLRTEGNLDRQARKQFLPLAGSMAVLLCSLVDCELASRADGPSSTGSGGTNALAHATALASRLNVVVDGFALRPKVLCALLKHMLRSVKSARKAVSEVMALVLRAAGPNQAALLRSFLLMEGGLLRDKKLGNLWDDLVLAGGGRRLTGSTAVEQRSQAGTSSKGLDEGDSQWAPNETTSGSKKKTDAASKEEENEKANSRSGLSDEEKETDESAGSGVGEEAVAKDEDGAAASGESSESSSEKDSDDDDEAEEEGEEEEDAEVDEEVDLSKAGNWVLDLVSQKGINRRVRDLYIVLEERFPTSDLPAPPLSDQLQRLPPDIPLFVSHGAAPILASVGGQLGLNIREESATSMREGSLMHEFSAILSAPGSWLLFDIADIVDFEELAEVLELMPKGGLKKPSKNQARMRFLTASYSVSPGQVSAGAILNLLGLDEEAAGKGKEPSRLILYSSTETTQVPRHLLHSCLCVQSTVSFFGIRAAPEPDGSESEDSEDWENLESGKASRVESQDSEDRIGGGLRAKEFPQGADWLNLIGHDAPRLTHEVFGYLAYTHPLLTACPTATRGHRFMAVMSGIAGDLNNAGGKKLRLALKCKPEDVPEWLEENVVSRAQCWAHRSAICAMLQSFSPSLVRRSDGEVRETLGVVSGKLCGFLQRVNAAANVLTLDSPFWLRLELHRAASGIQAARADIMACYSALVGDVCWNQHLFAVYMSSSHGRAFWASGRPLAAWLASLNEHVTFLTTWRSSDPPDAAPFRLGSVSDINSMLASYNHDGGRFHLRLEKRSGGPGEEKLKGASAPSSKSQLSGSTFRSLGSQVMSGGFPPSTSITGAQAVAGLFPSPALWVEGLQLVGATWKAACIAAEDLDDEYAAELPPMMLRLVKGHPPKIGDWYSCPLIIAHADAFGADLAEPPVAQILVKSAMSSTLCSIRGVRLVSYA